MLEFTTNLDENRQEISSMKNKKDRMIWTKLNVTTQRPIEWIRNLSKNVHAIIVFGLEFYFRPL